MTPLSFFSVIKIGLALADQEQGVLLLRVVRDGSRVA